MPDPYAGIRTLAAHHHRAYGHVLGRPEPAPDLTNPYRVLVTGSRDWPKPATVFTALNAAQREAAGRPLVIVHGACPTGADDHARHWARAHQRHGEPVIEDPHPADWRQHGPAGGPIRNREMVQLGADVCLAFIGPCRKRSCTRPQPHGSHGASDCADMAKAAGITVRRWPA